MAIVQSDLLIRVAIVHTIEEMKKNPWLIDDVFSDLIEDPLLKDIYGAREIANAKEWFANNKIEVLLNLRQDSIQTPCVTISLGNSPEDESVSTLADQSTCVEDLTPDQIGKPIPYILMPTTIENYDKDTGTLYFDKSVDLSLVSSGMLILDPKTGNAYSITDKGSNYLKIQDSPKLKASIYGVIPQYRFYRARRERAGFRESYTIGCHVHGDTAPLIWLHSVILYGLLRYRETLFEARGLQISSLRSTDFVQRAPFSQQSGENIFSRYIMLDGLVENSWIKSPKRIIESVIIADKKDDDSYDKRIKILSNLNTVDEDEDSSWITVKDE